MRVILKFKGYTNINTMLYDLKWMKIKQRLQFNTLMFVGKIKKGKAPKYLYE